MTKNSFRGDLSSISAKKEPLYVPPDFKHLARVSSDFCYLK